jgi:hypothetical protein
MFRSSLKQTTMADTVDSAPALASRTSMLSKDRSCRSKNQTIASDFRAQVPKRVVENFTEESQHAYNLGVVHQSAHEAERFLELNSGGLIRAPF